MIHKNKKHPNASHQGWNSSSGSLNNVKLKFRQQNWQAMGQIPEKIYGFNWEQFRKTNSRNAEMWGENTGLGNKDCKHRRNTRNAVLYKRHSARGHATLQPPATRCFRPGWDKPGGLSSRNLNLKAVNIENKQGRDRERKKMTPEEETYKIKQQLTTLKHKTMKYLKLVLYRPLQPAATNMGCSVFIYFSPDIILSFQVSDNIRKESCRDSCC